MAGSTAFDKGFRVTLVAVCAIGLLFMACYMYFEAMLNYNAVKITNKEVETSICIDTPVERQETVYSVLGKVPKYMARCAIRDVRGSEDILTDRYRYMVIGTAQYIEHHVNKKYYVDYLLSKAHFGRGIYGIDNAAVYYFNKSYDCLDDEEFTRLCSMIRDFQ